MLLFPEKPVSEIDLASIDLTLRLSGRTIATVSSSVEIYSTVKNASDPNPSELIVGSPSFSGNIVSQKIQGGVVNVNYMLKFVVTCTDTSIVEEEGLIRCVQFRT